MYAVPKGEHQFAMTDSFFDFETEEGQLNRLRFSAQRNAVYHAARRSFFAFFDRFFNFVVVFAGSAAFASIARVFDHSSETLAISTAIVVAAGLFNLVYGFSQQAGIHAAFQKEYYLISAETLEMQNTEENRSRIAARMERLYADEPPTYELVNSIAYNRVMNSMGGNKDELYVINWWDRFWGNFFRYEGVELPTYGSQRGGGVR